MSPRLSRGAGGALSAAALFAVPVVLVLVLFGGGSRLTAVFATETPETPAPESNASQSGNAATTAGAETKADEPKAAEPSFEFPTPMPAPVPESAVPEVREAHRPDENPLDLPPSASSSEGLLGRERYDYRSLGRRDPFRSLVSGEYLRGQGSELIDVGGMRLVGVMWGNGSRYALVEDARGFGYILRVGDPVRNGVVIDIDDTTISVEQTLFGQTAIVSFQLNRREGEGHE